MTFYALVIFIAVSILNIPDDQSKKSQIHVCVPSV